MVGGGGMHTHMIGGACMHTLLGQTAPCPPAPLAAFCLFTLIPYALPPAPPAAAPAPLLLALHPYSCPPAHHSGGGTAVVYAALDTHSNSHVALKVESKKGSLLSAFFFQKRGVGSCTWYSPLPPHVRGIPPCPPMYVVFPPALPCTWYSPLPPPSPRAPPPPVGLRVMMHPRYFALTRPHWCSCSQEGQVGQGSSAGPR